MIETFVGVAAPALKGASAVFSSRKMIMSSVCSCIGLAMSSRIVVTVMAGSGKSYLFESLVQEVKNKKMKRPGQSVVGEDHILYFGNGFLPKKITIVPGQNMAISNELFKKKIENNKNLEGIVHLLDFGYNSPRDNYSVSNYEAKGIFKFDDLRAYNLQDELTYLDRVVDRLVALEVKPKWFCLVLSKTDLYRTSDAISYYNDNSVFQGIISKLRRILSDDRIALFVPTCSDISSISYGKTNIHPKYVKNKTESTNMLIYFLSTIEMMDH